MRHFTGMPVGRPTKYTEDMGSRLISFFDRRADSGIRYGDKGQIIHGTIPPTFERFAFEHDVTVETLHEWKRVHPEFSECYKKAKQLQRSFYVEAIGSGIVSGAGAIFISKNETDMADTQMIDVTSKGERLGAGGKEVELLRDEYENKFKRLLQAVNPPAK